MSCPVNFTSPEIKTVLLKRLGLVDGLPETLRYKSYGTYASIKGDLYVLTPREQRCDHVASGKHLHRTRCHVHKVYRSICQRFSGQKPGLTRLVGEHVHV